DGTLKVWDVESAREHSSLRVDAGQVHGLAFSPDGRQLATVSEDAVVKVWDTDRVETGAANPLAWSLSGPDTKPPISVAFSPDGRLPAWAGNEFVGRVGDMGARAPQQVLRGYNWRINAVAFGPDSRHLASADENGKVRVWDVKTGREVADPPLSHGGG